MKIRSVEIPVSVNHKATHIEESSLGTYAINKTTLTRFSGESGDMAVRRDSPDRAVPASDVNVASFVYRNTDREIKPSLQRCPVVRSVLSRLPSNYSEFKNFSSTVDSKRAQGSQEEQENNASEP